MLIVITQGPWLNISRTIYIYVYIYIYISFLLVTSLLSHDLASWSEGQSREAVLQHGDLLSNYFIGMQKMTSKFRSMYKNLHLLTKRLGSSFVTAWSDSLMQGMQDYSDSWLHSHISICDKQVQSTGRSSQNADSSKGTQHWRCAAHDQDRKQDIIKSCRKNSLECWNQHTKAWDTSLTEHFWVIANLCFSAGISSEVQSWCSRWKLAFELQYLSRMNCLVYIQRWMKYLLFNKSIQSRPVSITQILSNSVTCLM